MPEHLSSLDSSFLRVETASAHMHVAWSARLDAPEDGSRVTLEALRASVAGRLERTPRFRRRLAHVPGGMSEPYWVDDEQFDIARHVVLLCDPDDRPDERRFRALADRALSEPLERTRPLWRVYLAPEDGRRRHGHGGQVPPRAGGRALGGRGGPPPFRCDPGRDPGSGTRLGAGAGSRGRPGSRSALSRGSGRVAARRAWGGEDRRHPARGWGAHVRHGAPGGIGGRRRPPAPGARVVPQRADRARSARWSATA